MSCMPFVSNLTNRRLCLIVLQAILQGLFDATVSSCKNMITKSQDDIADLRITDPGVLWERDIAAYLWHESANDVPTSMWETHSNGGAYRVKDSGLALKARACTPAVQR